MDDRGEYWRIEDLGGSFMIFDNIDDRGEYWKIEDLGGSKIVYDLW
jgi:hypothetical protein